MRTCANLSSQVLCPVLVEKMCKSSLVNTEEDINGITQNGEPRKNGFLLSDDVEKIDNERARLCDAEEKL